MADNNPPTRFDITDKNEGGRPPKLSDEERTEVYDLYKQYIIDNEDPILADFLTTERCIELDVLSHNIDDWQEFSKLKKIAIKKQEAYLLRKAGKNEYNPTVAIFRLKQKQHGYKDRVDTDITSGGEALAPVLVRFMGDTNTSTSD